MNRTHAHYFQHIEDVLYSTVGQGNLGYWKVEQWNVGLYDVGWWNDGMQESRMQNGLNNAGESQLKAYEGWPC